MKIKNLKELIDSTGSIISGDKTINHDFGSDKTSDEFEKLTRQGASNFYGYRRWWGEDDDKKPYSKLADKLQKNPKKFYEILKRNNKEKHFKDYFTNDDSTISEDLMKEMLEDIVKNKQPKDIVPSDGDTNIMDLETYSDEDPILVKWVMLVKDLWSERENSERIIIMNSLLNDINFDIVSPEIKNILISKINGE
tara:strand:+ start:2534 stop:3118 length:585 start_codon:yes stop_codon:yes gene_type:complete